MRHMPTGSDTSLLYSSLRNDVGERQCRAGVGGPPVLPKLVSPWISLSSPCVRDYLRVFSVLMMSKALTDVPSTPQTPTFESVTRPRQGSLRSNVGLNNSPLSFGESITLMRFYSSRFVRETIVRLLGRSTGLARSSLMRRAVMTKSPLDHCKT